MTSPDTAEHIVNDANVSSSSCAGEVAASENHNKTTTASGRESSSLVMKPEFPFFRERREPFFWFNNVIFLLALATFIYLAINIFRDFINNRNDPPTATNLRNGLSQSFPGMAFCIHRALDPTQGSQPNLQPLFAFFDNEEEGTVNITDQLKPIRCPNAPKQDETCWYLDGDFPAFNTRKCTSRNDILVGFSFNLAEYSKNVPLIGVDGFLFELQKDILESACDNELSFRCTGLSRYNECSSESTVGFEPFYATSSGVSLIQLQRSETQANPRCDTTIAQWSPRTVSANINQNYLDNMNVTISDQASTVIMDFQFFGADIVKTTYNPQSQASMLGSLSGWFGWLSDGWGLISLMFILEETINYLRALRTYKMGIASRD